MKRLLFPALALLFATNVFAADDDAAIRATIEHYFRAHATGDGSHLLKAFRPELNMMSARDGKFAMKTRDEFIAGFGGKPAADEAQRRREILSIDITGNAAVAKLRLDYPKVVFTDYFALLKIEGEWKVVTKIFHSEPRP